MTDYKKIDNVSEEAIPQFPVSRKNGYVEDSVDEWLKNHFSELSQMIAYQNSCVDEIERLEEVVKQLTSTNEDKDSQIAELVEAQANLVNAEQVSQVNELTQVAEEAKAHDKEKDDEIHDLRTQVNQLQVELQNAYAENEAQQATTVSQHQSDAEQATAILVSASEVAEAAKAAAREEATQIVLDAEQNLGQVKKDIIELEAKRNASYLALKKFYTEELEGLDTIAVFEDVVEDHTDVETTTETSNEEAEEGSDS